jgi:hypothetical protein
MQHMIIENIALVAPWAGLAIFIAVTTCSVYL